MVGNISVNTQSSIRICAGITVYFDPLHISGSPKDADFVFITHEHSDHFSPRDIEKVFSGGTRFLAPKSMRGALRRIGIDDERAAYLEPGERTSLPGIDVEAVAAYNTGKPFHPRKNGWLGYVVTLDGVRIYVCGDTDATDEAKAVRCDIICVPIGGTFTMNAAEAAGLVNAVKPETAIPIHYGSIVGSPSDAEEFERLTDKGISVVRKLRF